MSTAKNLPPNFRICTGAAARRSLRCRAILAAGALVAAAMLLGECARRSPGFPFTVDGARAPLYELQAKGGPPDALVFSLSRPVKIDRAGEGLFLAYSDAEAGLSLQATLPGAAGTVRAELPVAPKAGRTRELMLPLPEGVEVAGFRITGSPAAPRTDEVPEAEAWTNIAIQAAGIATVGSGIEITPSQVTLQPGYGYSMRGEAASGSPGGDAPGSGPVVEDLTFAPVTRQIIEVERASQVQVVLRYRFSSTASVAGAAPAASMGPRGGSGTASNPGAEGDEAQEATQPFPGRVMITAVRGDERRPYLLTPNPGEHTVYLYSASCRFSPESLRIESSDPDFHLLSLDVHPFSPTSLPATRPIPADLGAILTYDQRAWRSPQFELFSWSMVPDVLVFDFRDYHTQGEYLARFAYFIEKKGLRGRILTIPEVRGLDGWNAHDYRPEDVARFYNTAEEEGYPLRPGEETLKRILLSNGFLEEAGGRVQPGRGALISVAQSSWFGLRSLLLTHEAFHGIYFTQPAYREAVHEIWDHLEPAERLFWRLLFGSQEYDPTDRYLMINEFQAYLMQQPLQGVDPRYRGWAVAQVEREFPADAPTIRRMMADHPQIFLDTARELDAAVYRVAGVHAGKLITLVPQDWR